MDQSRHHYLDSLRGIAALIVVITHYIAAFYPYAVFGNQEFYRQHALWEHLFFYPPFGIITAAHFAVCLFFVLSGYVLSYRYLAEPLYQQRLITAIIKRPIRLSGLVIITIILGGGLWYFDAFFNRDISTITTSRPWFSDFWNDKLDFTEFLFTTVIAPFWHGEIYNPPLWSIRIELYGSIMVYLFLILFRCNRHRLIILLILIVLFKNYFYQGFWLGVFMADLVKNHNFQQRYKSRFFGSALCLLFLYFASYPNYVNFEFSQETVYRLLPDDLGYDGGYPMLAAFLLFVLICTNEQIRYTLDKSSLLLFLGKISYGVYVSHFLILGSLSSWIFSVLHPQYGHVVSFVSAVLIGIPVTLVVAHLLTKYVDIPNISIANFVSTKVMSIVIPKSDN